MGQIKAIHSCHTQLRMLKHNIWIRKKKHIQITQLIGLQSWGFYQEDYNQPIWATEKVLQSLTSATYMK